MSEVSGAACTSGIGAFYGSLLAHNNQLSRARSDSGSCKSNMVTEGSVSSFSAVTRPNTNHLSNAPTPPAVVNPQPQIAQPHTHGHMSNGNDTLLISATDQHTGQSRVFVCRLQTELCHGQQIHVMSGGALFATTITQLNNPMDATMPTATTNNTPSLAMLNNGVMPANPQAALLFNPLLQSLAAAKAGLLPQQLLSRLASVAHHHQQQHQQQQPLNGNHIVNPSCSLPLPPVDSLKEEPLNNNTNNNQNQYARLLAAAAAAHKPVMSNSICHSASSSLVHSTGVEGDDDHCSVSPVPSAQCSSSGQPILLSCAQNVRLSNADESELSVDGINLEEIKDFARAFKMKRLSLGLTQTQVGQALSMTEGPAYSQSAICRFEKLDITPKSAQKIKPVLEKWIGEMDEQVLAGLLSAQPHLNTNGASSRTSSTSTTNGNHSTHGDNHLANDPFDLNVIDAPDDHDNERSDTPHHYQSHSPVIKQLLMQQQQQQQLQQQLLLQQSQAQPQTQIQLQQPPPTTPSEDQLSSLLDKLDSFDPTADTNTRLVGSACLDAAALNATGLGKKRKRRTSFTPTALDLLNRFFERNTHPSGAEMTALAESLNYDREVVRVWFCNKRQALKNTIKKLKNSNSVFADADNLIVHE